MTSTWPLKAAISSGAEAPADVPGVEHPHSSQLEAVHGVRSRQVEEEDEPQLIPLADGERPDRHAVHRFPLRGDLQGVDHRGVPLDVARIAVEAIGVGAHDDQVRGLVDGGEPGERGLVGIGDDRLASPFEAESGVGVELDFHPGHSCRRTTRGETAVALRVGM